MKGITMILSFIMAWRLIVGKVWNDDTAECISTEHCQFSLTPVSKIRRVETLKLNVYTPDEPEKPWYPTTENLIWNTCIRKAFLHFSSGHKVFLKKISRVICVCVRVRVRTRG